MKAWVLQQAVYTLRYTLLTKRRVRVKIELLIADMERRGPARRGAGHRQRFKRRLHFPTRLNSTQWSAFQLLSWNARKRTQTAKHETACNNIT